MSTANSPHPRRAWRWFIPSCKTAMVVGTVLTMVNQWDRLLHQPFTIALASRMLLNFVVPFSVSIYSRRATERERVSVRTSS